MEKRMERQVWILRDGEPHTMYYTHKKDDHQASSEAMTNYLMQYGMKPGVHYSTEIKFPEIKPPLGNRPDTVSLTDEDIKAAIRNYIRPKYPDLPQDAPVRFKAEVQVNEEEAK